MTITFIRWRDAAYGVTDYPIDDTGLADLLECGFLLREDQWSLTVSMENHEGATSTRNWICVPKTGILERHDIPLDELVQIMKARHSAKPRRKAR